MHPFCNAFIMCTLHFVTVYILWRCTLCDVYVLKLSVLELLRCVQLRFVTLRHVTFTLCCFTLCSSIGHWLPPPVPPFLGKMGRIILVCILYICSYPLPKFQISLRSGNAILYLFVPFQSLFLIQLERGVLSSHNSRTTWGYQPLTPKEVGKGLHLCVRNLWRFMEGKNLTCFMTKFYDCIRLGGQSLVKNWFKSSLVVCAFYLWYAKFMLDIFFRNRNIHLHKKRRKLGAEKDDPWRPERRA